MPSITPIVKQFTLHNRLFNNVLEGITDEHGADRLGEHVNHLQWIAGHLVASRAGVGQALGLQPNFPYKEVYSDPTAPPPGNRALDASLTYPPLSEILYYWNEQAPRFVEAVAGVGDEQLATEMPPGGPFKTFFDMLGFVASHESYHIGQMSIIRRCLGLSAMSYR